MTQGRIQAPVPFEGLANIQLPRPNDPNGPQTPVVQCGAIRVRAQVRSFKSKGQVISVRVDDLNRLLKAAHALGWNAHVTWVDTLEQAKAMTLALNVVERGDGKGAQR